ncbi:hypothetical protein N0V93_001616 [Gnomoniopsis smithogilvyi]|uniref:Heterokaryon incompatibility domain-containing protein n=1 Tax=Gnomoniopsis smithogilvyi TaxID=1191159 RepID=A0A9W8Z484_9PEZI|nr:hypothetical protein N0V93_001616 [Gnomoniopsis smithogilvyi]
MPPVRFLDTSTQRLVVRTPKQLNKENASYAILSHVWDPNGEVVYQDIIDGTENLKPERSRRKLRIACERARHDEYKYIWIDTCCIDKSSSSELSEAINSMYAWYKDAKECYAYLDDAPDILDTPVAKDAFRRSIWFTRGWTLQELLAPKKVVFFSQNWECLGEKKAISPLLADITKIDEAILKGDLPVRSASIAKRISWASLRETTRPEDLAYCLMGLFGVNMPMLYGEGEQRAFLRLQEEIMKSSDDQSLFAWADRDPNRDPNALYGLLAPSPAAFKYSIGMLPYQDWEPREPYMMTNRGLYIQLYLTPLGDDIFVAALDCPVPPDYQDSSFLAIYLRKLSSDDHKDDQGQRYARIRVDQFGSVRVRGKLKWIYVRQDQQAQNQIGFFPQNVLQLRNGPSTRIYTLQRTVAVEDATRPSPLYLRQSSRSWVPEPCSLAYRLRKGATQLTVGLIFTRDDGEALAVLVGSVSGFEVGFGAIELDSEERERMMELTLEDLEDLAISSDPSDSGTLAAEAEEMLGRVVGTDDDPPDLEPTGTESNSFIEKSKPSTKWFHRLRRSQKQSD